MKTAQTSNQNKSKALSLYKNQQQQLSMSSEYSSSADQDDYPDPIKALFSSEAYLSNSGPILHDWKISLQLDDQEYLRREVGVIGSQAKLFLSGHQVRVVGFVVALEKRLGKIICEYEKIYSMDKSILATKEAVENIEVLDRQLLEIIKYLHIVEANNAIIFYINTYQDAVKQMYKLLAKATIYCIDLETLWQLLLTPKMFREEEANYMYKANFAAHPYAFHKQARNLMKKQSKIQKLLNNCSDDQAISKEELFSRMQHVVNSSLKEAMQFKIAAIIKGRFYTQQPPKSLKQEFMRASLAMYYCEGAEETWDYGQYQQLCLKVIRRVVVEPKEYIDCFLFMEPQNIPFQQRKYIPEFAEFFNTCLDQILKLCRQDCQQYLTIPIEFLSHILDQHNCQLFLHLLINFQSSSKSVYSLDQPQLHALFLNILEKLKKLYLSMSEDVCPIATTMFTPVTNRFFSKYSEDLSSEILRVLPQMVINFSSNEFPSKIVIKEEKITKTPMSKIQYLSALFYYSEDVKQKGEDIYLELPDCYPTDHLSALMFLESLKLKLKHHDPKEEQKQEYINILQECVNHYKIKPDFNWFKNKSYKNNAMQRQIQFNLQREIKQEWAQQVIQDVLNIRDEQFADDMRNRFQNSQIGLIDTVIPYWEHAIGFAPSNLNEFNVPEEHLFALLEQMQTFLSLNLGDLSNLNLDEQKLLNHLHLCLGFYNTKIQEAKGSEIYLIIIQKIILSWVSMPLEVGKKFKEKFKYFFSDFIVKDLYLFLGEGILDYLMETGLEQMDKHNALTKLRYFFECLYKEPIGSMPLEANVEFLGKIMSILSEEVDVDIVLQFADIFIVFFEAQKELEQNLSMEIIIDTIVTNQERLELGLKEIGKKQARKARAYVKLLLTKLPQIYHKTSMKTILHIIQLYFSSECSAENEELKNLLPSVMSKIQSPIEPSNNINDHFLPIIRALISLSNFPSEMPNHKEEWEKLDKAIQNKKCNLRQFQFSKAAKNGKKEGKDVQNLTLEEILSIFPQKVSSDIKNKAKLLKADENSSKVKENPSAYWQAQIWSKLVINCGTLEDFILFLEDISIFLNNSPIEKKANVKSFITEKSINNVLFKKIINKLPMLKECAEEVVLDFNKSQDAEKEITSQVVLKLILINSKFSSGLVEDFVLENIRKVETGNPIKIYQSYLVKDLKRELEAVDEKLLAKIFTLHTANREQIEKANGIFSKILCLPLKKFEKVKLLKEREQNIEEQNGDWETESDGNDSDDSSEIKKEKKREKNKKSACESEEDESCELHDSQVQLVEMMQNFEIDQSKLSKSNDGSISDSIGDSFSDEDDMYDIERPPLLDIFYESGNEGALELYKQIMHARELINLLVDDDYRPSNIRRVKQKNKEELLRYVKKINENLEHFALEEHSKLIMQKFPSSLRELLKENQCKIEVNEEQIQAERRPQLKQPSFFQTNNNEDEEQSDNYSMNDDEYTGDDDSDDSLSHESDDSDDIENGDVLDDDEQSMQKKEEVTIHEDLCADELISLELPDLKEINSKIETQLTGQELSALELTKILEISMLKLFSLDNAELKSNKSIYSFYKEIFKSRELFKVFNNSFFILMRSNQQANEQNFLEKKISDLGLSFKKALNAYFSLLLDFSQEPDTEGYVDYVLRTFASSEYPGDMLPVADEIILHYNLPIQDNLLTILIFYSQYKRNSQANNTRATLIQKAISAISEKEQAKKSTNFSANRAKTLAAHVFRNKNSSNFWQQIEERFDIQISNEIKLKSCIPAYRDKLFQSLKIVIEKNLSKDQSKSMMESKERIQIPFKYEQKVAEHVLKSYHKQIKHYYFWNKRLMNDMKEDKPSKSKLKKIAGSIAKNDQSLIKMTELMMFYLKSMKDRFGERSNEKVFKKIVAFPKCIIELSFMYLDLTDGWIQNWKTLDKIKLFFQNYQLGELKFVHLEQPCNLILYFLDKEAFCTSRLKQAIIPNLIKNQQNFESGKKKSTLSYEAKQNIKTIVYNLPLMFKLPSIPEDPDGQSIFVTRQCSFDMAFYQLSAKAMLVQFHEEEGSDHGGMVRELMMGWKGQGVGEEYFFIGKLLGISFARGIPYGGKFDYSMAIALTNFQPNLEFFKEVEKSIYDSLEYILNCEDEEEMEDLSQRFVISHEKYGVIREYPLKENGQNIDLTVANKNEYIQLYLQKYFSIGRQWEMEELKTGFYSVVNKYYAAIFHPFDLIKKIRGEEIDDYMKLKKRAKYEEGYSQSSDMIRWLWEILSKFDQYEMNQFIQFLTGSPKVSIYDPSFGFVVEKTYGDDGERLPVAHTCFNTLDLPEYKTKQILEKKLRQAIFQGNGNFGIL